MNSRLPSELMVSAAALTSTPPPAEVSPSRRRALSCSVWSRPIIQVPALARPL
jgi:hypothetical protein